MKEIKKYLDNRIGKYSFYFKELNCGYIYAHNENVKMFSAGCVKFPIAISLLKQVENKHLDLGEKIFIHKDDMIGSNGILHEFGEREYTMYELLVAMLIQSDNTASNKIIEILGMNEINNLIKEMGLENTEVIKKPNVNESPQKIVNSITTSVDLSKCWEILFHKLYINEENSNLIINILRRQQIKNKVTYYMPESVLDTIAGKAGDIKGAENDTIFMQLPKGNFIFTLMSKELPNNVYGTVTLTRCGKVLWDIINNHWN
jgi:beta-lactamase class A